MFLTSAEDRERKREWFLDPVPGIGSNNATNGTRAGDRENMNTQNHETHKKRKTFVRKFLYPSLTVSSVKLLRGTVVADDDDDDEVAVCLYVWNEMMLGLGEDFVPPFSRRARHRQGQDIRAG